MPEVTAIVEESSGELREIQVEVESPLTNIPIKYLGSYKFVNGLLLLFQNFPDSKIKFGDWGFYVYGSDRKYFDFNDGGESNYGLLKEWDWEADYSHDKIHENKPFSTGWYFGIYEDIINYADSKDIED
jgi:hypothetical protein